MFVERRWIWRFGSGYRMFVSDGEGTKIGWQTNKVCVFITSAGNFGVTVHMSMKYEKIGNSIEDTGAILRKGNISTEIAVHMLDGVL